MCDQARGCAVVEFLNGQMLVYKGARLPFKALTNTAYEQAVRDFAAADIEALHDLKNTTQPQRSLIRFKKAVLASQEASHQAVEENPIGYAFSRLDGVFMNGGPNISPKNLEYTQWNIVYNQTRRILYFRTRTAMAIKQIDLNQIDFSCSREVPFLDVDSAQSGDATARFQPITGKDRKELIEKFSIATAFQRLLVRTYPRLMSCAK
jgi:penicillin V acylase-like amidase (Ntn superfamily)